MKKALLSLMKVASCVLPVVKFVKRFGLAKDMFGKFIVLFNKHNAGFAINSIQYPPFYSCFHENPIFLRDPENNLLRLKSAKSVEWS